MPDWLKVLAHVNPLTYQVDALRTFMIAGGKTQYGLPFDFAALIFAMIILSVVAAKLYPSVAR